MITWWQSLNWPHALNIVFIVLLILAVLGVVLGALPRPRNRRLPPPSHACKRPGTQAVP